MSWMQKAGHVPIALFGGGTGMIGDPSGKTDMRKMLTKETIDHNIACFQKQMSRLIDSLMEDCEAVGICTMPDSEKALLLEEWGRRDEK